MQQMQQLASELPLMLAFFLGGALAYVAALWFKTRVCSSSRQKPAENIEKDSSSDLVQTPPVDQFCSIKLSTTLEAQPKPRLRIRRQAKPKDHMDTEKPTKAADMSSEIEEVATSQVSTSAGTTSTNGDTDKEVSTKSVNSRVEKIMAKKAMRKARKLSVLESGPSSDPAPEQSLPQAGIEEDNKISVELPSLPECVAFGDPGGQHTRMVGESSSTLATEGNDAEASAERVPAEQLAAVIGGEGPLTEAREALQDGELLVPEPNECVDKCRIDSCTSDLNVHGIDSVEVLEGEEEEQLKELAKLLDELTSENASNYNDEHEKVIQFASEPETHEPGASERASYPWKWESDDGNSKACWDSSCSSFWKVDPKDYQDDWMMPFDEILAMKGNNIEQFAKGNNAELSAENVPAYQLAAVIGGEHPLTEANAEAREGEEDCYDEDEKDAEYTSELPQTAELCASVRAPYPWKWENDDGTNKAWQVDPKDYQDDWMTPFDESFVAAPQLAPQSGSGLAPCAFEFAKCNDDWDRVRSLMHTLMCAEEDDIPMNTAAVVAQRPVAHTQDAKVAGSGIKPEAKTEEIVEVYLRLTQEALAEHQGRYADGHYKHLRIDG